MIVDQPITFPNGLVGLPDWRDFILTPVEARPHLWTLQHGEMPDICFVVTDPHGIGRPGPALLEPGDAGLIGHPQPGDLAVYYTLRAGDEAGGLTANLLGPLMVNRATGLGVQVVQYDSGLTTAEPVTLAELPQPAAAAAGA